MSGEDRSADLTAEALGFTEGMKQRPAENSEARLKISVQSPDKISNNFFF